MGSGDREIGLAVTTDRLGNMALRRDGRDAGRKPVLVGSHLDTQPTAGKFDGRYGVLAGLEILRRCMRRVPPPKHPPSW